MEASLVAIPEMIGRVRLEYKNAQTVLRVVRDDTCGLPAVTRRDNRWRWGEGAANFVAKHKIAKMLFRYRVNPSDDECFLMEDVVDLLGSVLDQIDEVIAQHNLQRAQRIIEQNRSVVGSVTTQELQDEQECENTQVYLMRHINGLTKIGISKNPRARERTLQAEDPRLHIIFAAPASKSVERRLHDIFCSARVRGEWFDLEPHHIDWIKAVVATCRREDAA